MTAQSATRPSPLTVAPIASRNRRAFTGHADAVREATHAAYDRITPARRGDETPTTPGRPRPPVKQRHRIRTRQALHSPAYLDAYAEHVLGHGPRPDIPAAA